jgi:hypothetical protein
LSARRASTRELVTIDRHDDPALTPDPHAVLLHAVANAEGLVVRPELTLDRFAVAVSIISQAPVSKVASVCVAVPSMRTA